MNTTPEPTMREAQHAFYNAIRSVDIPHALEQYPPFHVSTSLSPLKGTKIAGHMLEGMWESQWEEKNIHHMPLIERIEKRISQMDDDSIEEPEAYRAHLEQVIQHLHLTEICIINS
jgi:hypothetical protein